MSLILITRPLESAATLARQLEALGYSCLCEPMLSIKPTGTVMPSGSPVQAVMLTSGNALGVLSPAVVTALADYPCFCVGAATAAKASNAGFTNVYHSDGDGADLARLITATLPNATATILHVAAADVDSKAQQTLERAGFTVTVWQVYAALPVDHLSPAAVAALADGNVKGVVSFSKRSAEHLCSLVQQHGLGGKCGHSVAVGLSQTIADVLKSIAWRAVAVSAAPTEAALIACLQHHLPVSRMSDAPASSTETPKDLPKRDSSGPEIVATKPPRMKAFKQHLLTFALGAICCLVLTIAGLSWLEQHQAIPAVSAPVKPLAALPDPETPRAPQVSQGITLPAEPASDPQAKAMDASSMDKDDLIKRQAADIAKLQEDVKTLSTGLAAVQGEVKNSNDLEGRMQKTTELSIGLIMDFVELREVARTGRPFKDQLQAIAMDIGNMPMFATTGLSQKILTAMTADAETGVPSLEMLREQFNALRPDAERASAMATAQSWWERLLAKFKGLVMVRRIHEGKEIDIYGKIDQDLAMNDIYAAGQDSHNLPPETEPVFKDWNAALSKRIELETQLGDIGYILSGRQTNKVPFDGVPAYDPANAYQSPAPPQAPPPNPSDQP